MTKPNILIIMVDQLNGTLFPDGPADWLHAPNLKALAARSTTVRFHQRHHLQDPGGSSPSRRAWPRSSCSDHSDRARKSSEEIAQGS